MIKGINNYGNIAMENFINEAVKSIKEKLEAMIQMDLLNSTLRILVQLL